MSVGRDCYYCPAVKCRSTSDTERGIKIHVGAGHVASDFEGNEYPDWKKYFAKYE